MYLAYICITDIHEKREFKSDFPCRITPASILLFMGAKSGQAAIRITRIRKYTFFFKAKCKNNVTKRNKGRCTLELVKRNNNHQLVLLLCLKYTYP